MKRKKLLIFILIILGCTIIFLFLLPKQNNNITKIISDAFYDKYKEEKQIEIFETSNMLNNIIVGFTTDNKTKCGYAVLQLMDHSQYKLFNIKKSEDLLCRADNIFNDFVDLWDDKTNELISYYLFLNLNDKLSLIKIKENTIENDIIVSKSIPSMILIKFPGNSFEYLFLNKSGNLINQYK